DVGACLLRRCFSRLSSLPRLNSATWLANPGPVSRIVTRIGQIGKLSLGLDPALGAELRQFLNAPTKGSSGFELCTRYWVLATSLEWLRVSGVFYRQRRRGQDHLCLGIRDSPGANAASTLGLIGFDRPRTLARRRAGDAAG